MWMGAIVQKVRDVGARLVKKTHYDLYTLFQNLRDYEMGRSAKFDLRKNEKEYIYPNYIEIRSK